MQPERVAFLSLEEIIYFEAQMNSTKTTKSINYLVKVAMLGSLSYLVMMLQFPILPVVPFMKMDFSNVVTLIGGFALGPSAAFFIDSIRLMFDCVVDGTTTGYVGEFSAWLLGITYSVPASIIYKKRRTLKSATFAVILAFLLSNIVGILSNKFIMFPLFGMPEAKTNELLLIGVLPFNLIKFSCVSIIVMLLYKPLSPVIKKEYSLHSKAKKQEAIVEDEKNVEQK